MATMTMSQEAYLGRVLSYDEKEALVGLVEFARVEFIFSKNTTDRLQAETAKSDKQEDDMEVEQEQVLPNAQSQADAREIDAEEVQEAEDQLAAEARREEQERIRADLRARIAFQERGSGLRVADFSSGSQGRSDHQGLEGEGEVQDRSPPNENNNTSEVSFSDADNTTISDSETISNAGSDDGTAVCSTCRFNTNVVSLDPCPVCALDDMKETRNKRRRDTDEEEAKQSAKRAATGHERPNMPRTALDGLDNGRLRPSTCANKSAPPQIMPKPPTFNDGLIPRVSESLNLLARSNAVRARRGRSSTQNMRPKDKIQGPDRSRMLEVLRAARNKKRETDTSGRMHTPTQEIPSFLPPSPTTGIPRANDQTGLQTREHKQPSIRAPTPEEAAFEPDRLPRLSRNADQLETVTRRARRASIDLAFVARVVEAADAGGLEGAATSDQLDGAAIANEATRLNIFRELLGTNPEQPPVSDHTHLTHTPDESFNKGPLGGQANGKSEASAKPYDEAPSFDPTIGNEQFLKQLARMEYAMVENMPELEESDNDVPDEHNPGKTRRRIARTPEDDYPEPIDGGNMRLRPDQNVYWGKISHKLKDQTPDEYLDDRTAKFWHLEIARCKERHSAIMAARGNAISNGAAVGRRSPEKRRGDKNVASPLRS